MAVHTFSTQEKKREADHEAVVAVKEYCEKRGLNFSALVVSLLVDWKKEKIDE